MTEELRDVLLERFRSVYSSYGATDIEIGMAAESPVSVAVRRVARRRPDVRQALFGGDPRLPMVFQYNPLIHFLEVNEIGEIICTVSRLDLLAPRIRYNVTTRAGSSNSPTFAIGSLHSVSTSRRWAPPRRPLGRGPLPWSPPIPLPFLWVNGRRDATISVMGANIYPEDIETLVSIGTARVCIRSCCQSWMTKAACQADGRPRVGRPGRHRRSWRTRMADQLRDGLTGLNIDYRSSIAEFPDAMQPIITTYALGAGPFAADARRIKQRRIIRPPG